MNKNENLRSQASMWRMDARARSRQRDTAPRGRWGGQSVGSAHPRALQLALGTMLLVAATVSSVPGCAAEQPDEESDEPSTLAIWQGTEVIDAEQERFGLVSVRGCSAVAVASQWVMTMYHCGDKTGKVVNFLGRDYVVSQAFMNPGYPAQQNNDSQLLLLDRPLERPDGSLWEPSVSIMTGLEASDLVDRSLLCFGAAGRGDWREFPFHGGSVKNGFLRLRSDGAYLQPGDSGGPCFVFDYLGAPGQLVSITKGAFAEEPKPGTGEGGVVNPLRDELAQWMFWTIIGTPAP